MNMLKTLFAAAIFTTPVISQTFYDDSIAVRAILDSNHLDTVSVESVIDTAGGRIIQLYIPEYSISRIPAAIGKLTALQNCILSGNPVTELPPEVGLLESLRIFDCDHCTISQLPQEFGNLRKLNKIHLSDNGLRSLPKTIGNLESLKELSVPRNALTALPEAIGDCDSLEQAFLEENNLSVIGESIGKCNNLRELFLQNNQLTALPAHIGLLNNLMYLSLDKNRLTVLPEEIGNLKNLYSFSIDSNEISTLPASCARLATIEELSLGHNKIDEKSLSPEVIAWADLHDPDWRETQNISSISKPMKQVINSDGFIFCRNGIRFHVQKASPVTITLISAQGKIITVLLNKQLLPDRYFIPLTNAFLVPGVYYAFLAIGNNKFVQSGIFLGR